MEKLKISKVEDVHALSDGGKQFTGTLHLTNHHLIYRCKPIHLRHDEPPAKSREVWITYHIIHRCTFRPVAPTSKHRASIRLSGKDFLLITFNFSDLEKARKVFETIKDLTCKLPSIDKLYAFIYRGNPAENALADNGWQLYNPKAEFKRQGISEKVPDRGWRMTNINQDYQFSPTYPAQLWVPSSISDNVIKYAGAFRSKIRIPALTYLHPVNNCSITRCSQPMTGMGRGNRNAQDERLVAACFSASPKLGFDTPDAKLSPYSSQVLEAANIQDENTTEAMEDSLLESAEELSSDGPAIYGAQQRNLIVDARPTLNATMNAAMGKGSENMDNYRFAMKEYLGIENIHAMRDSLNMVIQALKDGDMTSLPPNRDLLAKSKWIKYNTSILDGSALIARQVGIHHSHVMIHCSDGWDRTSQLSALAQIMLDPYYRTLEGFMVLVEKDWVSFGHMFGLRCGHLSLEKWFKTEGGSGAVNSNSDETEENPNNMPRNETLESALNFGKRLFSKKVPTGEMDSDGEPIYEEPVDPNRPAGWVKGDQTRPGDVSPVFHQFLDCTHQLLIQHPTRFEFTDRFLRRLFYQLYACQYGTFLWNSEKDRKRARAEERTKSVWDYFLADKSKWINPEYDGGEVDDTVRGKERLIFPQLDKVRWWAELFNRRDEEMNGDIIPGAVKTSNTGTSTPSRKNSTGVVIGVQTADGEIIAPASDSGSASGRGNGGGSSRGSNFGGDGARSPRRDKLRSGESRGSGSGSGSGGTRDNGVDSLTSITQTIGRGEWPWQSEQPLDGELHYMEQNSQTSRWWGSFGANTSTETGETTLVLAADEAWIYNAGHGTLVRPKRAALSILPEVNLDAAEGTMTEEDKRALAGNGIFKVLSQDSALSSEHPGGHEVVMPHIPDIIMELDDGAFTASFDAEKLEAKGYQMPKVVFDKEAGKCVLKVLTDNEKAERKDMMEAIVSAKEREWAKKQAAMKEDEAEKLKKQEERKKQDDEEVKAMRSKVDEEEATIMEDKPEDEEEEVTMVEEDEEERIDIHEASKMVTSWIGFWEE